MLWNYLEKKAYFHNQRLMSTFYPLTRNVIVPKIILITSPNRMLKYSMPLEIPSLPETRLIMERKSCLNLPPDNSLPTVCFILLLMLNIGNIHCFMLYTCSNMLRAIAVTLWKCYKLDTCHPFLISIRKEFYS